MGRLNISPPPDQVHKTLKIFKCVLTESQEQYYDKNTTGKIETQGVFYDGIQKI